MRNWFLRWRAVTTTSSRRPWRWLSFRVRSPGGRVGGGVGGRVAAESWPEMSSSFVDQSRTRSIDVPRQLRHLSGFVPWLVVKRHTSDAWFSVHRQLCVPQALFFLTTTVSTANRGRMAQTNGLFKVSQRRTHMAGQLTCTARYAGCRSEAERVQNRAQDSRKPLSIRQPF